MSFVWVLSTPLTLGSDTFGKFKQRVARIGGAQADPDEVGAGEAIEEVLWELNGEVFEHLSVRGDDLTVYDNRTRTAGQEGYRGQYTIPTPVRDLLSVKLRASGGAADSGGQPLIWVKRIEWDRTYASMSGLGTRYVTDFQTGTTNKIEMLDWPEQAGTAEVRYYRPLVIPADDAAFMDLPPGSALAACVVHRARTIVANNLGLSRKASISAQLGDRAFAKAIAQDRKRIAETARWPSPITEREQEPEAARLWPSGWGEVS